MPRLALIVAASILLLSASSPAEAQSGAYLHHAPLALAESDLQPTVEPLPPTPTPPPPPVDELVIPLPFKILNSVTPAPLWYRGAWHVSVFRVDAGELNGGYSVRWVPGEATARAEQVTVSTTSLRSLQADMAAAVVPLVDYEGPLSISQGVNVAVSDDAPRYWFAYAGANGRTNALYVKVLER